jgi:hypothetical protein
VNKKLKKKKILKLFGINILLYSLLFGLVTLNKQVFRPAFNHSQLGSILTGSFPNFIAAYLINLCIVNGVWIRKPKFGRPIVYGLALIITAVLVHEEFKSIWGASTYFDAYDIVGSLTGSLLAVLTYEYLYFRKNHKLKI